MSTGPNIKVEGGSLGGLKLNLHCSCDQHLVAISPQSSPSTPGQGRSRIDTDPEGKKEMFKCSINNRKHEDNYGKKNHSRHRLLPETPPCWVCSCVGFWQRRRCPPCSGTGSSQGECCRRRRSHCDRRHYCRGEESSETSPTDDNTQRHPCCPEDESCRLCRPADNSFIATESLIF